VSLLRAASNIAELMTKHNGNVLLSLENGSDVVAQVCWVFLKKVVQ
jgi:hypothetical protein